MNFATNIVTLSLKSSRAFLSVNQSYFCKIHPRSVAKRFKQTQIKSPIMSKSALVILAEGAEEMETVITVDMLRRAGVAVTMAGLDSAAPVLCSRKVTLVPDKSLADALAEKAQYDAVAVTMAGLDSAAPVLCSRKVTLVPDKSLADALAEKAQYDAVILPGGLEGSDRLSKSAVVGTLLKEHEKAGRIVAAICAAPTAFAAHGVALGKRVTSYPSTKDKMADYQYVEGERVVVDGNIVTSRGPGTAYWFGLQLIEMLADKEKANQVEKGMLITNY